MKAFLSSRAGRQTSYRGTSPDTRSAEAVALTTQILVTIVIDNYNYGHFLRNAIDSALQQTYRPIEVIVVDDGSSDGSRQIIAGYGGQIRPVLKANGGQASALNAGFARSQGRIVIFLDADDGLLPDLVERVVAAYRKQPDVANVVYRLAMVDREHRTTGSTIPPAYLPLPSGAWGPNRFQTVMNCASWSPTSGNAFAASALRRIMPMPEGPFRLCADYYLSRMSALCGPIVGLQKVGGTYRCHEANAYHRAAVDLQQLRQRITFVHAAHQEVRAGAEALGLSRGDHEIVDEIFLAQRVISRKLAPEAHPLPGDRLLPLCRRGIAAALRRFDLPPLQKVVHAVWFAAMYITPSFCAPALATTFFADSRASFNRILTAVERGSQRALDARAHNQ